MKSSQLHKRVKKKTRKSKKKLTKFERLLIRAEKAYQSLPKWAKQAIGEEDSSYAIKSTAHSILIGFDVDPRTGIKYTARQMLLRNAGGRSRKSGMGTKRDIFKYFREMEPSVYAKYNSYMYRNGFSASQFFYDNVTLKKDKNYITATLSLPRAKDGRFSYSELEIFYNYSPKSEEEELQAFMYI